MAGEKSQKDYIVDTEYDNLNVIYSLMNMGLSERESKVYNVLLGVNEITAAAIPKFTDVPRTKVYEALASLIRKGFCKESTSCNPGGQTYKAVDPQIALEGLVREEEDRVRSLRQMHERVTGALNKMYRSRTARLEDYDFVEVVRGRQEQVHKYTTLRSNVRKEILEFSKGDYTMPEDEANIEADENAHLIAGGAEIKVIYESAEIDSYGDSYFHRKNREVGVQSRVIDTLPIKLSLFDKRVVMLPLADPLKTEPNLTALIIEHETLYKVLEEVFYNYWNKSKEINTHL